MDNEQYNKKRHEEALRIVHAWSIGMVDGVIKVAEMGYEAGYERATAKAQVEIDSLEHSYNLLEQERERLHEQLTEATKLLKGAE